MNCNLSAGRKKKKVRWGGGADFDRNYQLGAQISFYNTVRLKGVQEIKQPE
jgi:hypothetical protein